MKVSRSSIGFASLSLLALAGCPVTADDLCADGTCDAVSSTPDATAPDAQDAGGDAIVVLPRDPCVDKPLAPECISNDSALFVSAAADAATADGSITHPYKTITAAVNKVTSEKRRIYVCEGTYPEQVTLETIPKTLIGGVTCDFKGKGAKPKIAPPSGIAFAIAAVGGASVIDVSIEGASNPNEKGSSAVAMFVTRAQNILLRGVEAKAADAQPGADGAPPQENWTGFPAFAKNADGGAGAPPPDCGKCKDGTTFSFAGAGGSAPGPTGGYLPEGGTAMPPVGSPNFGNNAATCGAGGPGAPGEPSPAAAGATRPGVLQPSAWNTEPTAKAGGVGGPGQGGGGGGATSSLGGGSGGCGGCGGTGGGAGGNGGSSIALLVYESDVTIESSSFTAGNGGKGGTGAKGQDGQQGVNGGNGVCFGGPGGTGAGGGGGGGGAGGHSAAIAHVGAAPKHDETTFAKAAGGLPGGGGDPGSSAGKNGNPGTAGAEGTSAEILDITVK